MVDKNKAIIMPTLGIIYLFVSVDYLSRQGCVLSEKGTYIGANLI
jgi:hypothetical protein